MHDLLESSFRLSTIYIGIVKNFFINIYINQPLEKFELSTHCSYDLKYIEHWLDCAHSNKLIIFSHDKIILTEEGEKYVLGLGNNNEIVKVLRAIYNVIIVNKGFEIFDNKLEPSYSIIFKREFEQIIPFYKIISHETHAKIAINQVLADSDISLLLQNSKVIDYGCGDGWFIKLLKSKYPDNHYIGIDDEKTISTDQTNIDFDYLSYDQDIPFFDVLFLNRVIHHLGEKRIAILKSIIKKMNKDAHIVIWDFNWQKEKTIDFHEMAFLNLIEYIQGNTFIELNHVLKELDQLGLQTQHFFINDYKDFIVIAKIKEIME